MLKFPRPYPLEQHRVRFQESFCFFRNIRWSIVIWFVPPAIPAVWLGSWLLTFLNPFYLELMLGVFLLSNLPLIFKRKKEGVETHLPKGYLLVIGWTGFVSGLTGAVGLLFNRFYLRYGLSKEEIVATRAANEILLHSIKLVLYASFGLLTQQVLLFGLLIAFAAILSSLVVRKILPYISEQLFQRVGYTAMVISGMVMFSNASANLLQQNKASLSYQSIDKGVDMKMQWQKSTMELELELEYDEGFELEYPIQLKEIPLNKQKEIEQIALGADKLVLEEVYGIDKHYYEAYVYKEGKLSKYSISPKKKQEYDTSYRTPEGYE